MLLKLRSSISKLSDYQLQSGLCDFFNNYICLIYD